MIAGSEATKKSKGSSGEVDTSYGDEDDAADVCNRCDRSPCIWKENKEEMVRFDGSVDLLGDKDDGKEEKSHRRKRLYRQMTLIINDGPLGKGVRRDLPECVKNGIRELLPDADSTYMGFKEE